MKKYEIMTIVNITSGEEGARGISNEIKDFISSNNGKIINGDFWGKRKFAYPINKAEEGFYEVVEFEIDSTRIDSFRQKLNLMDGLVRYIINAV